LENKTFVNFKRAKWGLWTSEVESAITNVPDPTSCSTGEKIFRDILCKASGHHIAAGFRKDFIPGLPREAAALAKERDRLHKINPQDPEVLNLNAQITETIKARPRRSGKRRLRRAASKSVLRRAGGFFGHSLANNLVRLQISPFILGTSATQNQKLSLLGSVGNSRLLVHTSLICKRGELKEKV
jgi:hypothetical protein